MAWKDLTLNFSKTQNIGPYDFMIVAHARSRGLTLISTNAKEFDRVAGLRVENWVTTEAK